MKALKIIVGIILLIIVVIGLYNFFVLGLEDFGLRTEYYQCENGYYTYPRGIVDGSWTYHSLDGEEIVTCTSFNPDSEVEQRCREAHEAVGECSEHGFWLSIFTGGS